MTKVYAYYRVSTDKQVEANTIQNQVKIVRDFASSLNLTIEKEFYEEGESGANPERKKYHEMIMALNEVEGIVVYEVSRLSRDRRFSQRLAWDMEDNNKILYIAKDHSVNDFREMIVRIKFNLLSEIADETRTEIKARQKLGIQRKRALTNGVWGRRKKKVDWRFYDSLKAKGLSDHAISKVLEMDWRTLRRRIKERGY